MWGCEADLTAMLTEYIVHKSLDVPVMMSNLYPFLLGDAALKHERIQYFPEVDEPENHILVAHCGFFGVVPQSFATQWTLKPKVLGKTSATANKTAARMEIMLLLMDNCRSVGLLAPIGLCNGR